MSKYFALLLTLTFLVVAAMPVIAADEGSSAPAQAPMTKHVKMTKSMLVVGTIQSIDTVKNEIVIKDKKGMDKTISVDPAEIGELKTNDRVKITLKEGTMNVAANVTVIKMKKMAPPMTPPAAPEVK